MGHGLKSRVFIDEKSRGVLRFLGATSIAKKHLFREGFGENLIFSLAS